MAWEHVWGPTEFVMVDGETGAVYAKPAAAAGLAGSVVDDNKALFSMAGAVVSDVTGPASLRWLHDRPSGIRIKLLTGAGPAMQLEIGVSCP